MLSSCKPIWLECPAQLFATRGDLIMVFSLWVMVIVVLLLYDSPTSLTGLSRTHGDQCGERKAFTRFAVGMENVVSTPWFQQLPPKLMPRLLWSRTNNLNSILKHMQHSYLYRKYSCPSPICKLMCTLALQHLPTLLKLVGVVTDTGGVRRCGIVLESQVGYTVQSSAFEGTDNIPRSFRIVVYSSVRGMLVFNSFCKSFLYMSKIKRISPS